ncbi:AraC family transcriptional regulator [Marinomonas transparens]|uniref:Helix-turn-helix domain-containing protein n=1 Tax=Marinomonas transparens TaxID=2795388 RepID=A0A934N782_9GAMM|nr:AraC family transcriptional regulator [Marinomonas transparens]MBJ7538796.1 helix-turn-helix domain-containing protein [Marinomonas transparens]
MRDHIEVISYQETAATHSHQHTQIVLPLTGHLILDVESRQQPVEFGQACFISQGQAHTHLAETDNRCLILNALPVWDEEVQSTDNFINLTPQAQAYLPFLSSLIGDTANELAMAQALNLLEHLLPIPQDNTIKADSRLEKAQKILSHDFQQSWPLAKLAEEVHLSPSQLSLLFKRTLGITPKQYLLKRRLKEAQVYLESSDYPLEAIAQKIGLHDASALVRLFTTFYKVTPGHYRLSKRQESQSHNRVKH